MKHRLPILLILLCMLPFAGHAERLAQPSSTTGTPFNTTTGEDVPRIYVFENMDDALFTTTAPALWYEFSDLDNPLGGGSFNTFSNLTDGMTYLVVMGTERDTFAVFDYRKYRISNGTFRADLQCEQSLLHLDLPPMTYRALSGQSHVVERRFVLRYTNLTQDSVSWREEERADTLTVTNPAVIDIGRKIYIPTKFEFAGDQFAESFYDEADLRRINADEVEPVAIGFIPRSYTSLRGTKRENENQRVIEESVLSGSAPLNVLFRANATPAAEFFRWDILRSSDVISTRTENETRYVFDESGKYTVNLHVGNQAGCECDTTFQVDAKESLLAVPNVFTPNGDGVNDEFRVAYRSIASFSCAVFNRWQHQVYSSSDPARGWDGRINGKQAPEGAYYYVIEAVGTDGVRYKRKGAVNLLRGKKEIKSE
ncbi:MAG: gliding motility-associated C-terminal domain-containing protein [Paludibacteraceae bacterium]|nr:gliding motility-associated C-terminal domain-containing protein [Paludibacteraceae bacterium]